MTGYIIGISIKKPGTELVDISLNSIFIFGTELSDAAKKNSPRYCRIVPTIVEYPDLRNRYTLYNIHCIMLSTHVPTKFHIIITSTFKKSVTPEIKVLSTLPKELK